MLNTIKNLLLKSELECEEIVSHTFIINKDDEAAEKNVCDFKKGYLVYAENDDPYDCSCPSYWLVYNVFSCNWIWVKKNTQKVTDQDRINQIINEYNVLYVNTYGVIEELKQCECIYVSNFITLNTEFEKELKLEITGFLRDRINKCIDKKENQIKTLRKDYGFLKSFEQYI